MMTETPTATRPSDGPADPDPVEQQQDPALDDDQAPDPDGSPEPDDTEDDDQVAEPSELDDKGDREAARYRRQLRAAEAERDRLRSQVETFHRAEVERLAASRLIDGSDIWTAGTDLQSLLTDSGEVDPARVADAVSALAQARPHWVRSAAAPASAVTSRDKPGHPDGSATATTWQRVFDRTLHGSDAD